MNWKIIRILDTYVGIPLLYLLRCFKRALHPALHSRVRGNYDRILLIKFWGIGNLCMMLTSVRALKSAYPDTTIDLLTLESNKDAAASTGAFSQVYLIDTSGFFRFLATSLHTVKHLRSTGYDCIIDFEQFAKYSAILTALIGAKDTVGFITEDQHRHFLYGAPVLYDNNIHVTRSYHALVRAAGAHDRDHVQAQGSAPLFSENIQIEDGAQRLGIDSDRIVVVMHIGTSDNFKERRWPIEYYARLADLLIARCGVQIVITGLPEEASIGTAFMDRVQAADKVIDTVGRLSFREFIALIRMSDLVITADTSPVHLASAMGVPVVGLYGPNTPLLYGPWGTNDLVFYQQLACSPCITNFNAKMHVCRHPAGKGACMRMISPDAVFQGIHARYFESDSVDKLNKLQRTQPCIPS